MMVQQVELNYLFCGTEAEIIDTFLIVMNHHQNGHIAIWQYILICLAKGLEIQHKIFNGMK